MGLAVACDQTATQIHDTINGEEILSRTQNSPSPCHRLKEHQTARQIQSFAHPGLKTSLFSSLKQKGRSFRACDQRINYHAASSASVAIQVESFFFSSISMRYFLPPFLFFSSLAGGLATAACSGEDFLLLRRARRGCFSKIPASPKSASREKLSPAVRGERGWSRSGGADHHESIHLKSRRRRGREVLTTEGVHVVKARTRSLEGERCRSRGR